MSTVDLVLVAVRLAIGCWLLWSVRTVADRASAGGVDIAPGVLADTSVVIPARDEAGSIGRLVASIPAGAEVVVVDDHSSDGTADVARAAGARVVPSAPLPDGWTGKAWACAQGVEATNGSTLVFVDADVHFADGGFEAVVAEQASRGGLVSVQPFHEPGSPVESLAVIFNVVSFAGTDAASPLGRVRGSRGAFGPVLATSRSDHESVGGHEAVRSTVVDDVALAGRHRAAGRAVTILAGGDAVRFRMYPGGLGQMVEGFTKNMATGAGAIRRTTAALVVAWSTLLVQAAAAPALALAGHLELIPALALYGVVALQCWWMSRRLGRFGPLVALAFPVAVGLFLLVFARSVWATATGSVSWRGRRVSTRSAGGRPR